VGEPVFAHRGTDETDGGSETVEFIGVRLERKLQLEINREKTRVVDLREERANPGPDWRAESALERLDELLFLRVSLECLL
jgi:hypothetical protein